MSAWAQVRAGLLAVVIVINGIAALPIPHSIKRSSFEEAVAVEELAAQRVLLAKIGISLTAQEWEDVLFASGSAWVKVYEWTVKPFNPLLRITGTGQSWGLFTYPDTHPHRLIVEVREGADGPWREIYAGLHPEHRWKRELLAYRRVRGVYDSQTSKPGASWKNLTRWLARQAMTEDPEIAAVRVAFRRFHTVAPGKQAQSSSPMLRHARIWKRDEVMR